MVGRTVHPRRGRRVDERPRHAAGLAGAHPREALDAHEVGGVPGHGRARRLDVGVVHGAHGLRLVRFRSERLEVLHLRQLRLVRGRDMPFVERPAPQAADALHVAVHGHAGDAGAHERVAHGQHVSVLEFRDGTVAVHLAKEPHGVLASPRLARLRAVGVPVVCLAVRDPSAAERVHRLAFQHDGGRPARGLFPDPARGGDRHVAGAVGMQRDLASWRAQLPRRALLLAWQTHRVPPVAVVYVHCSFHGFPFVLFAQSVIKCYTPFRGTLILQWFIIP